MAVATGLVVHLFVEALGVAFASCVHRYQAVHLGVPDLLARKFSVQPVENTIASQQDKIIVGLVYFDMENVRVTNYYVWISLEFFHLGLCISESPRDRKPPGHHSHRTLSRWTPWPRQKNIVVLIDLPTSLNDPRLLR